MSTFQGGKMELIALSIIIGICLGKITFRGIKLGNSAVLFVGLSLSYLLGMLGQQTVTISNDLFDLSLIAFISAVGLMASRSIKPIIRTYGVKFIVQAFIITGAGALTTYIFLYFSMGMEGEIIGSYVGALTSSPGLAAALEIGGQSGKNLDAAIGLGYAIAYVPGVLMVVLFVQIIARRSDFEMNSDISKAYHSVELEKKSPSFNILLYIFVILLGLMIGGITVPLPAGNSFTLGITGGTLLSALILGGLNERFVFSDSVLKVIRDLGLNGFLAIVGLKYGYHAIEAVGTVGLKLLGIGIVTGLASIIMGYLVGKYLLKLPVPILIGSLCGGMTSTPGLAAAIDSFESSQVAAGYGAAYPFALINMILMTQFLLN